MPESAFMMTIGVQHRSESVFTLDPFNGPEYAGEGSPEIRVILNWFEELKRSCR